MMFDVNGYPLFRAGLMGGASVAWRLAARIRGGAHKSCQFGGKRAMFRLIKTTTTELKRDFA